MSGDKRRAIGHNARASGARPASAIPPAERGQDTVPDTAAPAPSLMEPAPLPFPPFRAEPIVAMHSAEWAIDDALARLESIRIELSQRRPSPEQESRLTALLEDLYRDSRKRLT